MNALNSSTFINFYIKLSLFTSEDRIENYSIRTFLCKVAEVVFAQFDTDLIFVFTLIIYEIRNIVIPFFRNVKDRLVRNINAQIFFSACSDQ